MYFIDVGNWVVHEDKLTWFKVKEVNDGQVVKLCVQGLKLFVPPTDVVPLPIKVLASNVTKPVGSVDNVAVVNKFPCKYKVWIEFGNGGSEVIRL